MPKRKISSFINGENEKFGEEEEEEEDDENASLYTPVIEWKCDKS
jgi:hypothetical protein